MSAAPLLHVLGGGPWQLPTVLLAKSIGLRVLVTDKYRERPAYAVADFHEVIDITDREATLRAALRHRIGGVLCDSTDVGVPAAAWVAERLGLPGIGYETALNCTNKARMRQCAARTGLVVPRHAEVREEGDLAAALRVVGTPLVVKPVDNQSGRGVRIVEDASSLVAAFRNALAFSRCGAVLLETAVAGIEIIVDGFVLDGHTLVLCVASKWPYDDNPTVASRILYAPEWSLPCPRPLVESACAALVAAVGLDNCVFHAEFIVDATRAVPIDFAARGGGVLIYRRVIPHVSEVDANRAMIELALGRPVRIAPLARRRAANIEFFRAPPGVFKALVGTDEAQAVPGIAALHVNLDAGAAVRSLECKDDRLGFLLALGDSTEEVLAASARAKTCLRVQMQGHPSLLPVH